jgi:4-hydroxybenzoate polyprenyltransferase
MAVAARRRGTLSLVLEGMRPRHWSKNAFVLGGLLFSGEALNLAAEARAWALVAAFCLASGAAYLANDVADAEADRRNPRTASRPVARGALSVRAALVAALLAALAALGIAASVNWKALLTLAGFLVLQGLYSLWLKHVLFVDVMTIAAGFVLRAYAGLVGLEVRISPWLLLATGLLALFLGLTKRRAEAVAIGGSAAPRRTVLEDYSVALLDELIAVVTPTTVMVYALYAVLGAPTQTMLLTVPFVIYGVFRVLFLIHHRSTLTEEPAVVVWHDPPLLACVVLWGIVSGTIVLVAS